MAASPELWTLLAAVCKNGAGVILLPLVLRTLGASELGFWYVAHAIYNFSNLLDMGFSQTIFRFAAGLKGGQKKFAAHGLVENKDAASADDAIAIAPPDFVAAIKLLHILIAVASVAVFIGSLAVSVPSKGQWEAVNSWTVVLTFAAATGYGAYTRWMPAVMLGCGEARRVGMVTVISSVSYVVCVGGMLKAGCGLYSLVCGQFIQPLVAHVLLWAPLQANFGSGMDRLTSRMASVRKVLSVLWPNAWRLGVVVFGAYLVNNANTLLAAHLLGPAVTATYGLSSQISNVITSMGLMLIQIRLPAVLACRVAGDRAGAKRIFSAQHVLAMSVVVAGLVAALTAAPWVLRLIGSRTELMASAPLAFLFFYRLLEFQHSSFSSFVIAGNKVPFMIPAIVSGVVIVALGYVGAVWFGIYGLLGATALVQLSFNNWWPITLALKEMGATFFEVHRVGVAALAARLRGLAT